MSNSKTTIQEEKLYLNLERAAAFCTMALAGINLAQGYVPASALCFSGSMVILHYADVLKEQIEIMQAQTNTFEEPSLGGR